MGAVAGPNPAPVRRVARDALGLQRLRPGQDEAVLPLLDGRDVLAVMPTGYGKSAIYQIAAVIRRGPTVVVSPLIALQRDQARSLSEADAGAAAIANSATPERERAMAFRDLARDRLEFMFLAPEQFANGDVVDAVRRARPSLFVIDEAHCVSAWGFDFRPDYLRLAGVAEAVGRPPILALTATASPLVREEIVALLRLRDPAVVVKGFDRPNIHLAVERYEEDRAKDEALVERVLEQRGAGIVYVATRANAERIAGLLRDVGAHASAYHAGMRTRARTDIEQRFTTGGLPVVVATTAFGMGIDRPDVRFVFHHAISGSIDEYYQEAGRAGRDGAPTNAILFYRPGDLGLRRFQTSGPTLDVELVERAAGRLTRGAATTDELARDVNAKKTKLDRALLFLERRGLAAFGTNDVVTWLGGASVDVAASAAEEAERIRHVRASRLEMMRSYAESPTCRRASILAYFGEQYRPPCGSCDVCEADPDARAAPAGRPGGVRAGQAVRHAEWGEGVVLSVSEDRIVAQFHSVGYRTLSPSLVETEGLLRPA